MGEEDREVAEAMTLFHRRLQAPGPLPADELAAWQAQDFHLAELVTWARHFRGYTVDELDARPAVTVKPGENVFAVLDHVSLIEPRSGGGHWVGRTQSVSVHVPGTRSMRYRIGGSRGHYVREPEQPTVIDTGGALVTDRRVAFAGPRQAREWLWSKVLGVEHEPDGPWTAIAVSNRAKVSGIRYESVDVADVRFRLDLAQAVAAGTVNAFAAELEAERAEHAQHKPGAPLPPPSV